MTTRKLLPLLALFVVAFTACQQEAKKVDSKAPVSSALTAPPPAAKPEIYLYAVTVDNLLLREQPNKSGKVITKFAEGALVKGLGEVSANKEEVTLREVVLLEPYFKVTAPATEQFGWAYGGGLKLAYAGSQAGSPDLNRLSQLTGFLKTLNTKQLDSGKKASDFVKTHYADANGALADAVFVLLEHFLHRMETEGEFYSMTEQIPWKDEDYAAIYENKFDMNKYPVTKSLAENGFVLESAEGMVFPLVDWDKLGAFFGPKVSASMKSFLDEEMLEKQNTDSEDGGLIIPIQQIADRAVFWEKFNQANPYFILRYETLESQRWMLIVLLNGMDNTPMSDYETKNVLEEYKKAWAYVQEKYPGTLVASKCKEISDLCLAEGWKRTQRVEDWQTKAVEDLSRL